jgi:hypothetical protein
MACTEVQIESAEYCDIREDEIAGLKSTLGITLHQDVQTYPTWTSAAGAGLTAMEASVTASGAIVMKATKKTFKIPCIFETGSMTIRQEGGAFVTEAKMRIQNTPHNLGFIKNLKGRFLANVNEACEGGKTYLIGQSDGISTGSLAKVKRGSVQVVSGEKYGDEKYIEFIIEAKPYMPVVYGGVITY